MRKFYLCFLTLILVSVYASSQTKSIMGNVTDENGNAVPFASVKIKNTTTGAAADAKGSFVIQCKYRRHIGCKCYRFCKQRSYCWQ